MWKMLLKCALASTDTSTDRMLVYTCDATCMHQHPAFQHTVVQLLVFMIGIGTKNGANSI